MSNLERQPKRKSLLTTIVVLLIGFGVGYVASDRIRIMSGLEPEYNSVAVMIEITAFVEKNKTWPHSWDALGTEPLSSVKVNWSLDVNTCDRYDVMMSVAPETGSFYTYPTAEQRLDDLWRMVLKVRDERSSQAVNENRR